MWRGVCIGLSALTLSANIVGENIVLADVLPPNPVSIVDLASCLPLETTHRLHDILKAHAHTEKLVRVSVHASIVGNDGIELTLNGYSLQQSLTLDRHYELTRNDCANTAELLAVVLEHFFTQLSNSKFPSITPSSVTERARFISLDLHAATHLTIDPLGGNGELGFGLNYGGITHRLQGTFYGRAAFPHDLAQGRVLQFSFLGGLGWRYHGTHWQPGIEARSGIMLLSGSGHTQNDTSVVPWVEFVASLLYRWSAVSLGIQASVSPLRHHATLTGSAEIADIPIVHFGIVLKVPIFEKKL